MHRSKVESFLDRTQEAVRWDLVFLDPPYPLDEPALAGVLAKLLPHLAEGAVVVVERSSRTPEPSWPDGMERFAERKYGETKLWFAEAGVRKKRLTTHRTEQLMTPQDAEPAGRRASPRARPGRRRRAPWRGAGPRAVSAAVHTSGHGPCVPVRMMLPG